ncbi:MAG: cell envelope integrity protein CreD [Bacteroidetes bacterium]|nr:cell envelope integrity protein CreD [Bacteroidota bacterium]
MINIHFKINIPLRIWLTTCLVLGVGWFLFMIFSGNLMYSFVGLLAAPGAAVASVPVLVILIIAMPFIERLKTNSRNKIINLGAICLACTALYGIAGALLFSPPIPYFNLNDFLFGLLWITGILFSCAFAAILIHLKKIQSFFSSPQKIYSSPQIKKMETSQIEPTAESSGQSTSSNKILLKGIITGVLILVMIIPTMFINNLVSEREARQKEVATEVSSKWAFAQTLAGPFLFLPYKTYYTTTEGKTVEENKHVWILPENLHVAGTIQHEIRPRSIYKVLLYRAGLQDNGNFILQLPKDVDPNSIQWKDSKICFGLSDFRGIEERMAVDFGGTQYELSPGLPENEIEKNGLSAPINITAADIGKNIPFAMNLKIKGSGQLHFVPLSGNSDFTLQSGWNSPSFDGNNLPTERTVTENGFTAKWVFNKANLPFSTVLKDFKFEQDNIAFGVTLLETADQYAKTNRCIKYAILFIGLTFSLFFIVELMQKKPVHPVQYILIGLALVIFYTLLLSISEFILFDYAYAVAAISTILLISWYARSHFRNWKSAGIFGGVLSVLYGFIFILIRLEDTALLVGSIGLFIVLALVMYASRNINWYGTNERQPAL